MTDTKRNMQRLNELLDKRDNRICADCDAPYPTWASANIGVFICLKCCSVHRGLGTHISKVMSVTLDEWSDDEVDAMVEIGGNGSANAIYEACLPEGYSRPNPNSSHEERKKFIRSKYEFQEFLKPSLRITSPSPKGSPNANMGGVENFIGLLKVKVIQGRNLVVRDIRTSDPYVLVTIGQEKVRTEVKKSNLNPVWDEVLLLQVPKNFGALKLQVVDHDLLSADDVMGEAEVDIKPLVTAATTFGDASMYADKQVGKWLASNNNALIRDSAINIVSGKLKQELSLKLQKVESGEIDLELEWMNL